MMEKSIYSSAKGSRMLRHSRASAKYTSPEKAPWVCAVALAFRCLVEVASPLSRDCTIGITVLFTQSLPECGVQRFLLGLYESVRICFFPLYCRVKLIP